MTTHSFGMLTVKADSLILPHDCPQNGDLGQGGTASYTDEFVLLMGQWCHRLHTFYDSDIYIPVTSFNVLKQLEAIELVESQPIRSTENKPDINDTRLLLDEEDRRYLTHLRTAFDDAMTLDPSINEDDAEAGPLRRELEAAGWTDFDNGWFKRYLRSEDSTYRKEGTAKYDRPSVGGFTQTGCSSHYDEFSWEYPHYSSPAWRIPAPKMVGLNLAPDFRGMDEADAI